jgi:hypothetical protein
MLSLRTPRNAKNRLIRWDRKYNKVGYINMNDIGTCKL